MAVQNFQVTMTGSSQPIITSGEIIAKWVIFQNNATHAMRAGNSVTATKGLNLAAGGAANPVPTSPITQTRLSTWNVIGTSGDLLDVIYDDGV